MGSDKYEIYDIYDNNIKKIPLKNMFKLSYQIGRIEHCPCDNIKNDIIFINIHSRDKLQLSNILKDIMELLKSKNNVIFLGDFNVSKFDKQCRFHFRKMQYDVCDNYGISCNIEKLYNIKNNECVKDIKLKYRLVNVLHKLKDYKILVEMLMVVITI